MCYILSTTSLSSETEELEGGGAPPSLRRTQRRGGSPPLRGLRQHPGEIFFGPYIRLGGPIYGFVHGFRTWFWTRWFSVHGFGCDGFRSMVLDASTCINTYCNIEMSIMKNQSSSPDFGIQGKISVYVCFMCYSLTLFIFCVLEFICR